MIRITSFFILCLIIGCNNNPSPNSLGGKWDLDNLIEKAISDTISIEYSVQENLDKITINTDSGIVVAIFRDNVLIGTEANTILSVVEFHFDNELNGVLSLYQIDTAFKHTKEDLRFRGDNYNFKLFEKNKKSFMLIDYHFNESGRSVDTIEYKIISDDKLFIFDKYVNKLE